MPDFTKDSLVPSHAQRQITCALTGDTIAKGDACFWISAVGIVRGDLDPDEVLAKLRKFNGKFPTPSPSPAKPAIAEQKTEEVSYQELCENIAQELETALIELKRRGIDYHYDTTALREYRDLHPRQDA